MSSSYKPFTPVEMRDEVEFKDLIEGNKYRVEKYLPNTRDSEPFTGQFLKKTTHGMVPRGNKVINNGNGVAVFKVISGETLYFAEYKDYTNGGCKFFHTKKSAAEAEKQRRRKVSTEVQLLSKDQFTGALPKDVTGKYNIASYLGGRTAGGKKTRRHRRRSHRKTKRHSSKRKRNTKRKRTSKRRR